MGLGVLRLPFWGGSGRQPAVRISPIRAKQAASLAQSHDSSNLHSAQQQPPSNLRQPATPVLPLAHIRAPYSAHLPHCRLNHAKLISCPGRLSLRLSERATSPPLPHARDSQELQRCITEACSLRDRRRVISQNYSPESAKMSLCQNRLQEERCVSDSRPRQPPKATLQHSR